MPFEQPNVFSRIRGAAAVNRHSFEAIILAGGLGTRHRSIVQEQPKAMVDVGGRPFLELLLDRMAHNAVVRVILATGHGHEPIERHFRHRWKGMEICYSVETRPLGTGGALWKALNLATLDDVFVFNGDTYFEVDLPRLYKVHLDTRADITLALKPMRNFDRYGTVEVKDGRIVGFREKAGVQEGLINGGIYLMNRPAIRRFVVPEEFSLETGFLETKISEIKLAAFIQDGYFIDIGIPDDYSRAQRELPSVCGTVAPPPRD